MFNAVFVAWTILPNNARLLHVRLQQTSALCLETTGAIKYFNLHLHQSMPQGAKQREVKH